MKLKVSSHIADKLDGLNKNDFRVQFFRSSGPGGQHRNKTDTAARITHIATGITAEAANSRSQADNKAAAFRKLIHKLIVHYRKDEIQERKMNLGWSEKIRTYHQPRGTVKDHRTGVELPFDDVMSGALDPFIDACVRKMEGGTGE